MELARIPQQARARVNDRDRDTRAQTNSSRTTARTPYAVPPDTDRADRYDPGGGQPCPLAIACWMRETMLAGDRRAPTWIAVIRPSGPIKTEVGN